MNGQQCDSNKYWLLTTIHYLAFYSVCCSNLRLSMSPFSFEESGWVEVVIVHLETWRCADCMQTGQQSLTPRFPGWPRCPVQAHTHPVSSTWPGVNLNTSASLTYPLESRNWTQLTPRLKFCSSDCLMFNSMSLDFSSFKDNNLFKGWSIREAIPRHPASSAWREEKPVWSG